MIQKSNFIQNLSVEFYGLTRDEVQEKLNRMEKWPSSREIDRIVPIDEACRRLSSIPLRELIGIGFVVVVEKDGALYPIRTLDLMTSINTGEMVKLAKNDIELAIAIKGKRAPLDEGLDI